MNGSYRFYSGPRPPKPRTFLMHRKKSGNKDGLNELSHYQDGVLCSVSPGLTVWPMGGVGDGVRWPELPNSVRWGEGEGPERGREAEKEGKRGR